VDAVILPIVVDVGYVIIAMKFVNAMMALVRRRISFRPAVLSEETAAKKYVQQVVQLLIFHLRQILHMHWQSVRIMGIVIARRECATASHRLVAVLVNDVRHIFYHFYSYFALILLSFAYCNSALSQ